MFPQIRLSIYAEAQHAICCIRGVAVAAGHPLRYRPEYLSADIHADGADVILTRNLTYWIPRKRSTSSWLKSAPRATRTQ